MPKKKQKATPEPQEIHPCSVKGCQENGLYKAPKSKSHLHQYEWYCLDHIREYNQKWDYFSGMSREEIEDFMEDALTGHHPTWSREEKLRWQEEKLHAAVEDFLRQAKKARKPQPHLSPKLREALAAMDMDYPFTAPELKKRYRALVKQLHPDAHKGDRAREEKFKIVTAAHITLAEHLKTQ